MGYKILTTSILVAMLGLSGCNKDQPAAPKAPQQPVKTEEQLAKERAQATQDEVKAVVEAMQKKHPETVKVLYAVNKVTLGKVDLFEVVTPIDIFYTDKDVNFILVGSMFMGEGKAVQNITVRPEVQEQLRLARQNAPESIEGTATEKTVGGSEFFKSLPLNNGFTYTYGTGANHIAVFEDPDCPFCQDLHKTLEQIGPQLNMKVTVFPFVMESIHPNALKRVEHLFCAKDPTTAWKEWMLTAATAREKGQKDMDALWATWSPKNAPNNTCAQAVLAETWQMAGRQFGFTATPTIVFENGSVVEGSADKQVFEQMFKDIAEQKLSASSSNSPSPTDPSQSAKEALEVPQN